MQMPPYSQPEPGGPVPVALRPLMLGAFLRDVCHRAASVSGPKSVLSLVSDAQQV